MGGFCLAIFVMAARGMIAGDSAFRIAWGAVPFLLVVCVFTGMDRNVWGWLPSNLTLHTAVGCVVGFVQVFFLDYRDLELTRMTSRQLYYGTDLALATNLLYGVPFLLFSWGERTKLQRTIAILGIVVMLLSGIFGATRAHIKVAAVLLIILAIIWIRQRETFRQLPKVLALSVVLVSLAAGGLQLALNSDWGMRSGFTISYDRLIERFTGKQTSVIERTLNDYRWYEAGLVMDKFSAADWFLGRGAAGTWSDFEAYEGREREMVHVGYVHLIFKGGLFLLVLFVWCPLLFGWCRLFTERTWFMLACAGVLANYSITLITGGAPNEEVGTVLIFLCAGASIFGSSGRNFRNESSCFQASPKQ